MENTENLSLPYIMPNQAQKHVTHNEALRMLDALVQLSVASRALANPPGAPANGERHIVASAGGGAWASWDGSVACYVDGAWVRLVPQPGWRAWIADEGVLVVFDGAVWIPLPAGGDGAFDLLGVNAEADGTNRLAVSSAASLFNHEGAGHQVKVNKNAAADTASFLFQTGFDGRAEIGTAGDDDFHVKVSPDGAAWRDAITIGRDDGKLAIGESFMNFSALNIKGRAIASGDAGWFGITVTQTDADNTPKGGAVLTGAPYANADKPFMVLGPWATGGSHVIYYGGGGWSVPSATEHLFWVGSFQPSVDDASTRAFTINDTGIWSNRDNLPDVDNIYSLGGASNRWSVVYAATGTISTSDERLKRDIAPAPLGLAFVRDLTPVAYRWKIGGYDVVRERIVDPEPKGEVAGEISVDRLVSRPGSRIHYGLVAQQVKAALDAHGVEDFAGWTLADRDDPASEQGLRYDQFVPILVKAVQELADQVEALASQRA